MAHANTSYLTVIEPMFPVGNIDKIHQLRRLELYTPNCRFCSCNKATDIHKGSKKCLEFKSLVAYLLTKQLPISVTQLNVFPWFLYFGTLNFKIKRQ